MMIKKKWIFWCETDKNTEKNCKCFEDTTMFLLALSIISHLLHVPHNVFSSKNLNLNKIQAKNQVS